MESEWEGSCLIAIYLQNWAFDTHDEPALLTVASRGGQHSSAHTLLRADFPERALYLNLFLKSRLCILREAPIQGLLFFFFFVIAGRPTEPPTQGCPQRESEMLNPLKKLWGNKKGFPYVPRCLQILPFPPCYTELTDKCLFVGPKQGQKKIRE